MISAFSTGFGAAASINLETSITLGSGSIKERNPVVIKTLEFLESKFGKRLDYSLKIESEIPMGVGLKSSSALTSAIVLAYLKANDISIQEPAAVTAEASIYNHTSATGAIDDASCSIYGGLCISDNIKNRILKRVEMKDIGLLICWPKHIKRNSYEMTHEKMSVLGRSVNGLMKLLDSGNVYETMALNGLIHGSFLGSDFNPCGKMYSLGASYSSFSGKGPAVFAIFEDNDTLLKAKEKFDMVDYEIVETRFSNRPARVE